MSYKKIKIFAKNVKKLAERVCLSLQALILLFSRYISDFVSARDYYKPMAKLDSVYPQDYCSLSVFATSKVQKLKLLLSSQDLQFKLDRLAQMIELISINNRCGIEIRIKGNHTDLV